MNKPPSRSANPKSRGVPDLSDRRYQVKIIDDNGGVEAAFYEYSMDAIIRQVKAHESRDRLSPPEIDPTQHRAAKRGAAASARRSRG